MDLGKKEENDGHGNGSTRTVAASYEAYEQAQGAVDHLSDEGFKVNRVSIIANDLRFVEQVTGRVGYGRAVLQGASPGAIIGALFGLVFGLFSLIDPLVSGATLAIYGVVFGAVVGAAIGLISHALSGGRRGFSSVSSLQAGRYDVIVDEEVSEEAARMLAEARLLERVR